MGMTLVENPFITLLLLTPYVFVALLVLLRKHLSVLKCFSNLCPKTLRPNDFKAYVFFIFSDFFAIALCILLFLDLVQLASISNSYPLDAGADISYFINDVMSYQTACFILVLVLCCFAYRNEHAKVKKQSMLNSERILKRNVFRTSLILGGTTVLLLLVVLYLPEINTDHGSSNHLEVFVILIARYDWLTVVFQIWIWWIIKMILWTYMNYISIRTIKINEI
jgi:hypothetical protein